MCASPVGKLLQGLQHRVFPVLTVRCATFWAVNGFRTFGPSSSHGEPHPTRRLLTSVLLSLNGIFGKSFIPPSVIWVSRGHPNFGHFSALLLPAIVNCQSEHCAKKFLLLAPLHLESLHSFSLTFPVLNLFQSQISESDRKLLCGVSSSVLFASKMTSASCFATPQSHLWPLPSFSTRLQLAL